MTIKSVHITNYYHRNSGGISTAYDKLLNAANRYGRHVRLIVPGGESRSEPVGEFGRIYFVKANYSPVFDKRYRVMLPWKTYVFDKAPIKSILRAEKPDIIEIGEKYSLSLMAGLLRRGIMNVSEKRPMLVHLSCERMDDNVRSFITRIGAVRRLSQWYIRNYISPMFDFHLANSTYTASELFDAMSPVVGAGTETILNFSWRVLRAPKVPLHDRVFVNQCGVDAETFRKERRSAKTRAGILELYRLPSNAKILLYAGRLSPEKNVDILPEIMELLARDSRDDYRLVIAGAGPRHKWLKEQFAKRAVGKVTMLGNIDDRNVLADLFANSDVFIHPNPHEPFGIAPLEAMASGLPVVAPNSGGLLSYANNENAYLVEPNPGSFATAIRAALHNNEERRSKVKKALETARKFTWEASTAALFSLYDRMYGEFTNNRGLYDYRGRPREVNFAEIVSKKAAKAFVGHTSSIQS